MATSREHFALDWIKGELLETLNTARTGLESFAEALENGEPVEAAVAGDDLRGCVNALHQVHGTLVMLELKGVGLLADHLERLADRLREGGLADVSGACQSLMQGILELPGYLDELQSGMPDSEGALLPLVNELRAQLGEAPLEAGDGGPRLYGVAGPEALQRFTAIDGQGKTRKIRGVYQQVLLSLLKGGELGRAVDTLRKVAQSMAKVCEGTPFESQWQAFGEFVEGLAAGAGNGPLDAAAVKLLRRVDSEIRELAQSGAPALQRPVPINLVRQLVEAAKARGRTSPLLDAIDDAAAQGDQSDTMSLSGRQALVSAATALREELSSVKDRLDLFVRGDRADTAGLHDLLAPLKQIASTLSLVGFESSKSIVLDQVELLASLAEAGQADEGTILSIAGALVQVDENLASLTHSGKGEAEKITDDAQRAVVHQTREGLDQVKQSIVDYVSSQWDVRHLQDTPAQLDSIIGALGIVPLTQAAELIQRCQNYMRLELMAGHVPSWEELDRLADALSGIDYYLERLASDNPGGAEDVLELAQRSLEGLGTDAAAVAEPSDTAEPMAELEADAESPTPDVAAADAVSPDVESAVDTARSDTDAEPAQDAPEEAAPSSEPAAEPSAESSPGPESLPDNVQPLFGAAEDVDVSGVTADEDVEPELEMEADADFDLSSALFDDISGDVVNREADSAAEPAADAGEATADDEAFDLELEEIDDSEAGDIGSGVTDVDLELLDAHPEPEADRGRDGPSEEAPDADAAVEEPPLEPVAASLPAGLADDFESDDEIIEIFSEEVDEVLAAIDEHLEPWSSALDDEHRQTEIRRAFHTLKGSGRMVGANVLGEMAWSVENMLNRLLEGTVAVTGDFPVVVRQARELTPTLRDTFERKESPEMTAVARVIEQADLVASGGSLADSEEPLDAEPAQPEERNEDHALFVEEAESYLAALEAARGDGGFLLNDEAMRALHTLSGSAAMAGLDTVSELAGPAYELAQALRRPGVETQLGGEAADFFGQVTEAMSGMLTELKAGGEPEEQFQLVAEADRLLMEAQAAPVADTLLSLPALTDILKAPQLLEGWKDGAVDLSLADEVSAALADIERVAGEESRASLSALAGALKRAHERFEFESLDDEAHRLFSRGHDELLSQIDAVAADQTPADASATCADLDAMVPAAAPAATEELADDLADMDLDLTPEDLAAEAAGEPSVGDLDRTVGDLDRLEESVGASEDDDLLDLDEIADLADADTGSTDSSVDESGIERVEPTAAAAEPSAEQPADTMPGAAAADASDVVPEDVDADIIEVFFEEADELLEALDQGISDWSDEPDNRLHLENLLRALHTLKGGARLSGLTRLGDETHEFESYLIEFQESDRLADAAMFGELHDRYDSIAALVGRIRAAIAGESPAPEQPAAVRAADEPEPEAPGASAPESGAPEHGDAEPAAHDEPAPRHEPASRDEATPRDEPADVLAASNVASLRKASEAAQIARAMPQPPGQTEAPAEPRQEPLAAQARGAQEMVRVGAGLLEELVNLAGESSIIRARVEQGMSDFTGALDEMETTIERLREQLRRLEIETETQVLFRQERVDGPSYEDFDPLEMDRYSQLQQLSRALGESASDMLDLKETLLYKAREAETLLLQQARVNTELQEGLMRSRMVPFSRLVPRLKRTVRQVAKELGKEVDLQAFNVEGELDRSLLERMVPPLEHMLRNAVDHGIEKPERRRSVGKSEGGRIDLRLAREGGDVVIEISDDGAGIDVERVRAKALERGLMAADADLRDDEICQFVLAPGFSTAASVTQISGRGVGMDVVHSEVKQLGGSISIHSEQGRGTRFVLRVPFTVSVNRALMLAVGDDLYAIPLNTIEGIVLLSPEELDALYAPDGHTFEYAGVPYRIQYLGSFLGREYHAQPMRGSVPVVLVRSGEHAVAVHVDAVQGSREIVVKSLGPQFAGVGGISGATILGDGSVVVILDLLALIRSRASAAGQGSGKRTLAGAARTRCVMVVDDSVTVRKVTSRLLERQGMNVIVAKDGVEAVSLLQEQRPDVMLLDIEMPRMDGFEVLRQVRHDERLKDLPIVMISSRTGTKHQERAAGLGVNRFLGKPFQESELLSTIDELVD